MEKGDKIKLRGLVMTVTKVTDDMIFYTSEKGEGAIPHWMAETAEIVERSIHP